MPKRQYAVITERRTGISFRFALETAEPVVLHIEARHSVTADEAIRAFLDRQTTIWNDANKRWESESDTHVLYWALHARGEILVITCFRKGE